jgi:hypothetical protein
MYCLFTATVCVAHSNNGQSATLLHVIVVLVSLACLTCVGNT